MNASLTPLLIILAALAIVAAAVFYGRYLKRKKILRAAKQGDPQAQYEAALLLYHGHSTAKNWPLAFSYLKSAADSGHIKATNALGALYCAGHGADKDTDKAFACYERTAQQGDFEGMINLAAMYRARKQDEQAFRWLQKAADGNSPLGQRLLAEFYQTGIGVAADEQLALKYYTLAAQQGEPGAVKFLKNRTPGLQRNTPL